MATDDSHTDHKDTMDDKYKVETSLEADEERCDTAPAQVEDLNGHLKRGLKERHLQFIAIGGTIGTGLFLGIGAALATSGPLSLLLGYTFSSVAMWVMVGRHGKRWQKALLIHPYTDAMLGRDDHTATTAWHDCTTGVPFC
jgi:amino acid permease